jgi:hypothetical protein
VQEFHETENIAQSFKKPRPHNKPTQPHENGIDLDPDNRSSSIGSGVTGTTVNQVRQNRAKSATTGTLSEYLTARNNTSSIRRPGRPPRSVNENGNDTRGHVPTDGKRRSTLHDSDDELQGPITVPKQTPHPSAVEVDEDADLLDNSKDTIELPPSNIKQTQFGRSSGKSPASAPTQLPSKRSQLPPARQSRQYQFHHLAWSGLKIAFPADPQGRFQINQKEKVCGFYYDGVLTKEDPIFEFSIAKISMIWYGSGKSSKMCIHLHGYQINECIDVEMSSHKQLWEAIKDLQAVNPDINITFKEESVSFLVVMILVE